MTTHAKATYVADLDFTLHAGDVRDVLRTMPDESVHCVITSPPYWGLRDYGATGQLGLEPTHDEYVANMVDVFREVRRVLRRDGTCWLNIGDSYAGGGGYAPNAPSNQGGGVNRSAKTFETRKRHPHFNGLKEKDLVGIPWRLAFALQADGWYLRADIIWAKPNPMPESVTDRPTKAHEYVFLLTRSARYFFDQEAVREANAPAYQGTADSSRVMSAATLARREAYETSAGAHLRAKGSGGNSGIRDSGAAAYNGMGRNIRSVWEIATQPYAEAHFATFPEALVERCVKAGTSERGCCPECGAPWEREVERERPAEQTARQRHITRSQMNGKPVASTGTNSTTFGIPAADLPAPKTTAWREPCNCRSEWNAEREETQPRHKSAGCGDGAASRRVIPCTVLDPFMGSGTTALVARRLGRKSIGIELNEEYARLCLRRLSLPDETGAVPATAADGHAQLSLLA